MIGATHSRCSKGVMPASSTSTSATHLNISASSAWESDCGSGIAAPMALARVSNSMPMPSQSTVCSCRYQANPSTPTCVMLPPKQPYRSINAVRAPARAAASAAARPPGPLPTTNTSVSKITSSTRAASATVFTVDLSAQGSLPWRPGGAGKIAGSSSSWFETGRPANRRLYQFRSVNALTFTSKNERMRLMRRRMQRHRLVAFAAMVTAQIRPR